LKDKLTELLISLNKDSLRSTLVRDGMGSLFLKAGYILLTFGTTVLLARGLGAQDYGVFSYVYALISLLSIPAQFGLPTLVVRETAQAMARKEYGFVQGVWLWARPRRVYISGERVFLQNMCIRFIGGWRLFC
jgi:hypothetical protein